MSSAEMESLTEFGMILIYYFSSETNYGLVETIMIWIVLVSRSMQNEW
jgi:hypothetical protein